MKKLQRILALAGVILLAALYGSTLFFAVSDSPDADGWFRASIFCTIVIPVFLYAYTLVYRYLKGKGQELLEEERKAQQKEKGKEKGKKKDD